jgi:2-oxoglutarate ferredoxin oxidoreductase subunit beta
VLGGILRAVDRVGLRKDDVVMVSGIGCSSRAPGYVDFNTLHATHGRAIAFATGVKLAKPRLTVIVVSGDGDCAAIGGNHFIHAARRNVDLTVVVFNNSIYGMTGGQVSPATPYGMKASTAPYGSLEPPFDISDLAASAGATFVARTTAYHVGQIDKFVERGIRNRGFSVVEVATPCPTSFGRRNRLGTGVDMLKRLKETAVPMSRATSMTEEELRDKVTIGVLMQRDRPEYTEEYGKLRERVREGA